MKILKVRKVDADNSKMACDIALQCFNDAVKIREILKKLRHLVDNKETADNHRNNKMCGYRLDDLVKALNEAITQAHIVQDTLEF